MDLLRKLSQKLNEAKSSADRRTTMQYVKIELAKVGTNDIKVKIHGTKNTMWLNVNKENMSEIESAMNAGMTDGYANKIQIHGDKGNSKWLNIDDVTKPMILKFLKSHMGVNESTKLTESTRTGTHIFDSLNSAVAYYKPYGYNKKDVQAKINDGSIEVMSMDEVKKKYKGKKVSIIKGEGRYQYED